MFYVKGPNLGGCQWARLQWAGLLWCKEILYSLISVKVD